MTRRPPQPKPPITDRPPAWPAPPVLGDRLCLCCGRQESRIDHVRVGREGKVLAVRMRKLMSWYRASEVH